MTKVRQTRGTGEPAGNGESHPIRDPKWATALVLGAVAVATLAITGSANAVPIVLAPVLLGLGYAPRSH